MVDVEVFVFVVVVMAGCLCICRCGVGRGIGIAGGILVSSGGVWDIGGDGGWGCWDKWNRVKDKVVIDPFLAPASFPFFAILRHRDQLLEGAVRWRFRQQVSR